MRPRGLLRWYPIAVPINGSYTGRILKATGDGLPESGESGGKGSNNPPDREPLAVTVPSFIGMKLPRVGK
jgi:hypothetical protein